MASKKSSIGFVMALLFSLGLLIAYLTSRKSPNTSRTKATIINGLTNAGFSGAFARMWVAVAQHETGNFTSSLYRNANNIVGMTYPTVGKDYGWTIGEGGMKFSKYPDVKDAVDDLIEYLLAFGYPKDFETVADLVAFMKSKSYFSGDQSVYTKAVQSFYFEGLGLLVHGKRLKL